MNNELDHCLSLFTNLNNPAFLALLFIVLLLFLAVITYRQIIIPHKLNNEFAKEELLLKTRELETKLLESEQKFSSLSFHLHDQIEKEKKRIGMELHDNIGQNLLLVNLKLKNTRDNYEGFKQNISEVQTALDLAIKDLREVMYDLRPRALEELGLYAAVSSLSSKMSNTFNIKGSVDCSGVPARLDINNELYLYRIIQESLTNILKHSYASEFHVQFIYANDKLRILISDNGVGFDTEKIFSSKGYGLINMRERIKYLKGKMEIESDNQSGTLLLFELPIVG